jgi:hypothetical protein
MGAGDKDIHEKMNFGLLCAPCAKSHSKRTMDIPNVRDKAITSQKETREEMWSKAAFSLFHSNTKKHKPLKKSINKTSSKLRGSAFHEIFL